MIKSFETTLLEKLGLVADFDPEYAQWSYTFVRPPLRLEFIYSLDGTVSTSLYFDDTLLAFNYASGLHCLSINEDEISCDIISGPLRRALTFNINSLRVKWQDL
ncbi:hypothetical protein C1S65_19890 [Pseudomonas putida]|uniref:Uncharacterized protein n=1 Tax=Pseudomonas putida TaxID=303 RepID=A0AAD0LBH8_PSEPU|nr:hypothetical protein C1S65_19890 [Pseudomonas putida]